MGYSLQRPRAPLDQLAKLPTNERSFNGLLTSTPTRTGLCLSPTSTDKRLCVSMGYSLQRPRALAKKAAETSRCLCSFNGLLTSTPTRTQKAERANKL